LLSSCLQYSQPQPVGNTLKCALDSGGGFDVYAGLPLALSLLAMGKRVHLANFSFSYLELLDLDCWLAENVAKVTPATGGTDILGGESWMISGPIRATTIQDQNAGSRRNAGSPRSRRNVYEA
jgi:hypothetical protein